MYLESRIALYLFYSFFKRVAELDISTALFHDNVILSLYLFFFRSLVELVFIINKREKKTYSIALLRLFYQKGSVMCNSKFPLTCTITYTQYKLHTVRQLESWTSPNFLKLCRRFQYLYDFKAPVAMKRCSTVLHHDTHQEIKYNVPGDQRNDLPTPEVRAIPLHLNNSVFTLITVT